MPGDQTNASQCPDFPHFGAVYPDACCIDGLLWDLDSSDDKGWLTVGGEVPCPFCNKEGYIDHIKDDCYENSEIDDDGNMLITDEEMLRRATRIADLINEKYNK